jgi:hypothetical protein
MKYDIIGDIHGHVNDLKGLLKKMGYGLSETGYFYHPDRQAVFVGDYIDRGKNSKEVVQLVRAMQENGSAIALLGNHEYNALCFHTKRSDGEYLRPRTNQNIMQHHATLNSFGDEGFLMDTLSWFFTLPLYWEETSLRAVHACWDSQHITVLKRYFDDGCIKPEYLEESTNKKTPLYEAIENVIKGRELKLPPGRIFKDKDNHVRGDIRVKWWEHPHGKNYREYAVKIEEGYEDLHDAIPADALTGPIYGDDEKPVFFGHYWLETEAPLLQKRNVCCLDYSVANKGKLVAYRFNGEQYLNPLNFVY